MSASKCDQCGEVVHDIDAGFSPGVHAMGHECGGTWRVLTEADVLDAVRAAGRGEMPIVIAPVEREIAYLRDAIAKEADTGIRARMQARLDDVLGGRDLLREDPS